MRLFKYWMLRRTFKLNRDEISALRRKLQSQEAVSRVVTFSSAYKDDRLEEQQRGGACIAGIGELKIPQIIFREI
jgi:hypothetical protein